MIADASTIDRTAFDRTFDVCVIGAGPAGITLARSLAAAGAQVALMEAGGLEITVETQDVYAAPIIGQEYFDLDMARLRYFGGTSNHWGGWSRALDAVDFRPKPWVPLSGWPIAQIELDPYRAEADAILDLPRATEAPDLPMRQTGYDFHRFQFRFSTPTRFGEKYQAEIEASDRISLVPQRQPRRPPPRRRPRDRHRRGLQGYDPADPGFTVKARAFCALHRRHRERAAPPQLPQPDPEGIGNRTDLVGRFFGDHPHFLIAEAVLEGLVRSASSTPRPRSSWPRTA